MCNCISSNRPESHQTEKAVTLIPPFPSYPAGKPPIPHRSISIDACIVRVMHELWRNRYYTYSSCCGHNKHRPSIIFKENLSKEDARKIRAVIKAVDHREFEILSWTLTEIL